MASNGKFILKVFLYLFITTLLMAGGFFFIVYKAIDSSIEESKRKEALPTLGGKIYSQNNVVAPVSGDSVAFYILEYSANHHSGPNSSHTTRHDRIVSTDQQISLLNKNDSLLLSTKSFIIIDQKDKKENRNWKVALTLAFNGPQELPPNLLGVDPRLDCMIGSAYHHNFDKDIGIDLRCTSGNYTSVHVTEYVWKKGDTLAVKAEVIDGAVTLLR
ncbi:MAG: hypothetical protein N4A46_09170 [Schleiferiaceae bacterium]|jgi:hypothetical protein|nr:hypothetical protein [Schleiferiaceae bacterium]